MGKNYCSIDLFKFIASILVVVIHTRPFYSDADVNYYVTSFCRIAVPFFFIATSFFFFSKENPDIKRYTKRLLDLYIIWFFIEIPIVYKRFFVDYDNSFPFQIINLIRSLIFGNTWRASWFIMACILSVNAIYWLSKKMNNLKLLIVGTLGYLLALACSSYNNVLDLYINDNMRYIHATVSSLFTPANSFIVALLYVVLGKIIAEYIRKNQIKIGMSSNIILLLVSGVLLGREVYLIKRNITTLINDAYLFLPLFTFLEFILLLKINIYIPSVVSRYLRSISILVYILHTVFAYYINHILGFEPYGELLFVVTLFESVLFAFLIVALSNRLPLLKKLY